MRQDMAKVLCETYKEGSGYATTQRLRRKKIFGQIFDEVGGKFGAKHLMKMCRVGTKSFGENLAPLERFIKKQVGRPWSKVYSEICANCDRKSAVGGHIFQHLFDFISPPENVKFKDGVAGEFGYYSRYFRPFSENELYVDPNDDIIKKGKRSKKAPTEWELLNEEKKRRKKVISPYLEYHKIGDIWYRYDLKDVPKPVMTLCPPPGVTEWTWRLISKEEKALTGVLRPVIPIVQDAFRSDFYDRAGKLLNLVVPDASNGTTAASSRFYKNRGQRYYAQRSQASKKEKKKYGLD